MQRTIHIQKVTRVFEAAFQGAKFFLEVPLNQAFGREIA